MTRLSLVVASSIIFSLPSLASAAQAREGGAVLTVTVKDSYGVIPGASVRVVAKDTQASQRLVAGPDGTAAFTGLAAGSYEVRGSFSGFADKEQH